MTPVFRHLQAIGSGACDGFPMVSYWLLWLRRQG
jgi:hypothetical protein